MTTRQTKIRTARIIAPLMATLVTGCVASQADVQVLQHDIATVRAEMATSDSLRRVQLERVVSMMRATNDSIVALTNRMYRFRSDMSTSMSSVEQQLLQIQELTGQSQRRLQEVRASLEERQQQQPPAPTGTPPNSTGDTGNTGNANPEGPAPGPNQLFQMAREQLMQGSNAAARDAFQDLLNKYPKSDVAPDAQFYIAESYAAEGKTDAADSVYARVAMKYAGSPRAATALYKRGMAAQRAKNTARARLIYNELIKKYPRSDEAALAQDQLKLLNK